MLKPKSFPKSSHANFSPKDVFENSPMGYSCKIICHRKSPNRRSVCVCEFKLQILWKLWRWMDLTIEIKRDEESIITFVISFGIRIESHTPLHEPLIRLNSLTHTPLDRLSTSVTRCGNKKFHENSKDSFHLKNDIFKNSPKSCQIIAILLYENFLLRHLKNNPIWSPCSLISPFASGLPQKFEYYGYWV